MRIEVRELSPGEYPLWDQLLSSSPQRSLFAQHWWMNTVTQGEYRLVGCYDGDRLVGGMPIWPCSKLGIPRLRQPPLTPYWGPVLMPIEGKSPSRYSLETDILQALARALAPWPDVLAACHPSLQNVMPFYWHDCALSVRYTFRIERLAQDLPTGSKVHRSVRNGLSRATSRNLSIQPNVSPEIITDMCRLSMGRQGLESSADIRAFWPTLIRRARERNCVYNAAAVDPEGQVHFAGAILWDDRYAYYLMSGGPPELRESFGGALVLQHLLEYAAAIVPAFDFEGSMLEYVANHFRRFGGEVTPYYTIARAKSLRLNTARAMQDIVKALTRRKTGQPVAHKADIRQPAEAA